MQSLWTRAATPVSHSCRCYRCANASRNVASGQNISVASRRRLLIGNGVTLLYSSIFASAAVLDAKWKDSRRMDRDKQIEAVKAEVQELKEEEVRLLAQMKRRRKPSGLLHNFQTRQYTTAASVGSATPHGKNETIIPPEYDAYRMRNSDYPEQSILRVLEPESETGELDEDESSWLTTSLHPSNSFGRQRAIQLLAVKQLAFKLLLRQNVVHYYEGVGKGRGASPNTSTVDFQALLDAIESNNERIRNIRSSAAAPFEDLVNPVTLEEHSRLLDERKELENSLWSAFERYKQRELSLDQFLVEVSDNLLAAKEPILPTTLSFLIHAFNKARQNDIVYVVMNTLFPNGFPLTHFSISASINFFARTKDVGRFEDFLYRLREDCNSLQRRPWKIVWVDGVFISVPDGSCHPYVALSLVSAALNFDQPHRADAWLKYFKSQGHRPTGLVLREYLRYYTRYENWDRGLPILQECVEHLKEVDPDGQGYVERLILFMMVFCRSCDKHELARAIMTSAVTSGIDSTRSNTNNDRLDGVTATLERWRKVQATAKNAVPDQPPKGRNQYYVFARKIENLVNKEVLAATMPKQQAKQSDTRSQEEAPLSELRKEIRNLKQILLPQHDGLQGGSIPRVKGRIRRRSMPLYTKDSHSAQSNSEVLDPASDYDPADRSSPNTMTPHRSEPVSTSTRRYYGHFKRKKGNRRSFSTSSHTQVSLLKASGLRST